MTGEVLQGGQDALGAHAEDEGAGVLGDERGIGAEAPRRADDHRVRRVVADVDDRRQVPVDPGRPQQPPDPPRLELGQNEVVRLAELLSRERARPAGAGRETHHAAALGVDRDEELAARAGLRSLQQRRREPGELRGVHDVPREQHRAADARAAEEGVEVGRSTVGALNPHQKERAQLGLEGRQASGIGSDRGPAAGGQDDDEEASGDEPRQPASPPSRDRRAAARRRRASPTCRR